MDVGTFHSSENRYNVLRRHCTWLLKRCNESDASPRITRVMSLLHSIIIII